MGKKSSPPPAPAAPPAPDPIDPGQSMGEYLFGKGFGSYKGITDPRLQNRLLQSERTYRPQYAALELADINTFLLGIPPSDAAIQSGAQQVAQTQEGAAPSAYETGYPRVGGKGGRKNRNKGDSGIEGENLFPRGQMGILDLTAEATRRSAALDREAQALQRQQEIDILSKYGQQTVDALRAADPYSRQIAEAQQQYAADLFARSGTLSMEDQRAAEQMARAQGLASGRVGDTSTIAAQALNRQNALAQRSAMAQQAGAQSFNYNRALAGDIANILIGRPSTAYAMGSQAAGQGIGIAGQPIGPNLFDPNAGVNIALQNQANIGNYNASIYGAQAGYQSSVFGAKAAREGAIIGGGLSALGSIGGGAAIAF